MQNIFNTIILAFVIANCASGMSIIKKKLQPANSPSTKIEKKDSRQVPERVKRYQKGWQKASMRTTINKFAPNAKLSNSADGVKKYHLNEKTKIRVVEDIAGRYFRIEDTQLKGKRRFLDLSGKVPSNKLLSNGTQKGRTQSEYNQVTHFNNID